MSDDRFTRQDELQHHQLDLLKRILPASDESLSADSFQGRSATRVESSTFDDRQLRDTATDWGLPADVTPYPWQEAALNEWEGAGRRGVVKVVTGAGKTLFALMCLERLLRENPDARASIIVPTRVLLAQWYDELTRTLGLPSELIGRRSTDWKEDFGGARRVMIQVINSARKNLGEPLSDLDLAEHHFLIVDECHRAGSAINSRIFEVPRRWSLGLSATPERETPDEAEPGDAVPDTVLEQLGGIVYELTFAEALEEGIIPPFEILHCGVDLTPDERREYDKLTREMDDLRDRLTPFVASVRGSRSGFQAIRILASKSAGEGPRLARAYQALTGRRKELLFAARNRELAFRVILRLERAEGARVMVFHERIEHVNRLYAKLCREGERAVLDHTGLTDSQRERSLELYLDGSAPILVSVKALIEGVNAPATDTGVILAATSSPRQKVQSMGRVLRRHPGKDLSRIWNLYVRDSADEGIFRNLDFERLLGAKRVEYRTWSEETDWGELDGPPHRPKPADEEIDTESLEPGDLYPGADEGTELRLDASGNVSCDSIVEGRPVRRWLRLPPDLLGMIRELKGGGGRFTVSPIRGYVVVPARGDEGEWELRFAGRIDLPLQWSDQSESPGMALAIHGSGGGSVMLDLGARKLIDNRTPAAKTILAAMRTAGDATGEKLYHLSLDAGGVVRTRLHGEELEIGRLDPEDGWPFGKASFEELAEETEDDL